MAFGFHLVTISDRSGNDALQSADDTAGSLGFSTRAATEHGLLKRYYRQSQQQPELEMVFDLGSGRYQIAMYPLEEKDVDAYGVDILVSFWSRMAISLNAALGRTFPESGYTIQETEIDGPLQFVDWYQYFSPAIVGRWGVSYLRNGPFHRVEEYPNDAVGIWLAKSPFERLGRTKAAQYLGVTLPKLYFRNPQTGERLDMPWD